MSDYSAETATVLVGHPYLPQSTWRDGEIGKLVIYNLSASPYGTKVSEIYPGRCDFLDPASGREVLENTVPMDLMKERGTIGASHGWVATLKDGIVRLQDDLIPSGSDSDPKRISLPNPVGNQRGHVLLFSQGRQLSLCRPGKSKWVNIRVDGPAFSSRVMYSKRDQMFSMVASGGTHIGSWR